MTAAGVIAAAIETDGPISFSRYMELALYHPLHGFYATGGAGRRRDFITSPEVGPLFGVLVARALDGWWDELGRPEEFWFVEVGAGPGTLARSIASAQPACSTALRYVAVETSAAQRAMHPASVTSVAAMPHDAEVGVVFANEFLDNLPFDVLHFEPGSGWFEVLVGLQGSELVEVLAPTSDGRSLPEVADVSLRVPDQKAAAGWLAESLAALRHGRVVAVDYAVSAYPAPASRGWLRTYRAHERGRGPLEHPGMQDITADVDIAGLRAVAPTRSERDQAQWLRMLGIDELVAEGRAHWVANVAAPDLAAIAMRSRVTEAEALLDPSGLGGFAVLEWSVGDG